ncbi:MAG: adenosine kinase [Pleopsidium flavum]|nr:MAG: adenosine kinase [Pleopsidium flavum]
MAETQDYALLCLENPLLDIQGQGDAKLLEKYGMKPNDAILAEEKHMGLYEDLLQNHKAKLIAGGAAQNTARGAQYILVPNSVLYIGCVGRDKYADILTSACRDAGLRTEYRIDDTQPTGRCGVIITGHDRSMCTHLAAANEYKLEHLQQPDVWAMVERARVFYVGGYHLTVCVPAVMALAEEAAKKNKIFILSLSAPFIPQFFTQPLSQTSPYWDYLIGNETEALAYATANSLNTTDISTIAKHIALLPKKNGKRARTVIVTQGTDPTVVAIAEGHGEGDEKGGEGNVVIKEFPVRKVGTEEICDTNGAGTHRTHHQYQPITSELRREGRLLTITVGRDRDAFAGGFVAGIVQGKPLEQAIDMGQWLASLSIRELGPS